MSSSQSNRSRIDDQYVMQVDDFNQYKVKDHVSTRIFNTNSTISGIIESISVSDQSVLLLIDGTSKIRKYKAADLLGHIVENKNNNLINFVCV